MRGKGILIRNVGAMLGITPAYAGKRGTELLNE